MDSNVDKLMKSHTDLMRKPIYTIKRVSENHFTDLLDESKEEDNGP